MDTLRNIKSIRRDARGFTLGEVMITIIIMGILAGIAIPSFFSVVESRRVDSATKPNGRGPAAGARQGIKPVDGLSCVRSQRLRDLPDRSSDRTRIRTVRSSITTLGNAHSPGWYEDRNGRPSRSAPTDQWKRHPSVPYVQTGGPPRSAPAQSRSRSRPTATRAQT